MMSSCSFLSLQLDGSGREMEPKLHAWNEDRLDDYAAKHTLHELD